MISKYVKRGLGMIVLGAAVFISFAASAETLTLYVRKTYPGTISLNFQSTQRDHAWPGGEYAYVIRDSQKYRFYLSCNKDEQICFGAWVRGNPDTYWGLGRDRKDYGCEKCCYVCNNGFTNMIVLQR